jgi:hypothetical protein
MVGVGNSPLGLSRMKFTNKHPHGNN